MGQRLGRRRIAHIPRLAYSQLLRNRASARVARDCLVVSPQLARADVLGVQLAGFAGGMVRHGLDRAARCGAV